MKLIIGGETGWGWLERATYRGAIGLFYEDTLSGLLAYLIFGLICLFAIIGIFSLLKWVFFRRKPKEDPGKKWLRTGKM